MLYKIVLGIIMPLCYLISLGVNAQELLTDERYAFNIALNDSRTNSTEDLPPKKDKKRLFQSTKVLLYGNALGAVALFALPESVTNWDKSDIKNIKWWDHVSRAPVWDRDDFFLNYVTHPYWGAVYYVQGRQAGYSKAESGLVAFAYSFMWEYGIEAFAEKPSVQDLVITPLGGILLGEMFYSGIKHIQKNDYTLANSKILGVIAVFALDPMHFIVNKMNAKTHSTHYGVTPNGGVKVSFNVGF